MQLQKMSGQLFQDLGRQILSGDLKSGQVLPSVEALSEIKGVSRTVTREALKGLSTLGLVESQPKVGTVVRDRSEWQWWNRDVLRWSIDSAMSSTMSQHFLLELAEVRLAIEPAAVSLAARNANEDDFLVMQDAFQRLQQSVEVEEQWVTADYEFHSSIIAGAHNELMLSLIRILREALLYSRRTTIPVLKDQRQQSSDVALGQHKAVLDAVCSRDEEAAYRTMTELLKSVTNLIENSDGRSLRNGFKSREI